MKKNKRRGRILREAGRADLREERGEGRGEGEKNRRRRKRKKKKEEKKKKRRKISSLIRACRQQYLCTTIKWGFSDVLLFNTSLKLMTC
jgi:hypothetical protein